MCVVVEPASCSGGTMDLATSTNETPLFGDGPLLNLSTTDDYWPIRVFDLNATTWTVCDEAHNAPHTSYYIQHCQTDALPLLALVLLGGMLSMQVVLMCFCRPYSSVALFWCNDLLAGLGSAILVEKDFHGSGCLVSQVMLLVLVTGVGLGYDAPAMVLKWCNVRPSIWNGFCIVMGCSYGFFAIVHAYLPSGITILGHHPLVVGFVSFCLDFPKEMLKNFVRRRCSNEGYHFFIDDLNNPLPESCRVAEVDKNERQLIMEEEEGGPDWFA